MFRRATQQSHNRRRSEAGFSRSVIVKRHCEWGTIGSVQHSNMEHGGNVYVAARISGRPVSRVIDFSANINPLGPSPQAIRAVASALSLTAHYPDPDCVIVRDALATRYRLDPEQLLIGNGASELIHLLPRSLPIHCALIIGPTFTEYERAVSLEGGRVVTVHAGRLDGYQPPIERAIGILAQRKDSVDAVFLCNPNNPTGQSVNREAVCRLVEAATKCRAWTVVDESFIEYCEERSVVPVLHRYPRLLVLRSLTKFYAIPALRIGYLAGEKAIIRQIRRRQPPWSVNALAQVAAVASINDDRYARRTLRFVERQRERLMKRLESIPGVRAYPSIANFLLVELPGTCLAKVIARSLCRDGLLIRDCSSLPGLTPRMIRVAVRTDAQNRRLIEALRSLLC